MEITEEKLKEILDTQRKECQTFFGEIKEYFDSKLQLFSEQYDTLIKMSSSLIEDLQIIKTDIESIKEPLRKKD